MAARTSGLSALLAALCSGCALLGEPLPPSVASPTVAVDAQQQIVVTVRDDSLPALRAAGSTLRTLYASAPYRRSPKARQAVRDLAAEHALQLLDEWPIAMLGVHCAVLGVSTGQERSAVLEALAADARVESAQPMQRFDALAPAPAPVADPERSLQRALEVLQIGPAHLHALGRGVRVAVIDTGADRSHPDLRERIVGSVDFVGDDDGAFDEDAHGTAVAGVLAATAGNGEGIVGVAPLAELVLLKACWNAGTKQAICNSFTLARALVAAVDAGAEVINLSLSGPHDRLLERLLRAALARGVRIVAAIPDEALSSFPAQVEGVIAVGSLDRGGEAEIPLVFAPGTDVLTTAPGRRYAFESGSSLAAAQVAGVVALLLERDPALRGSALRELLDASSNAGGAVAAVANRRAPVSACRALSLLLGSGACAEIAAGP